MSQGDKTFIAITQTITLIHEITEDKRINKKVRDEIKKKFKKITEASK